MFFLKTIKLAAVFFILFTLLGYRPHLGMPPVKQSTVRAEIQEQKGEVFAKSFSKPLILPHPGYLTTKYSSYHPGIDIATGLGMPIHPVIDGEVVEVGRDIFGLGNFVTVSHESGFKSKYAHMGRIFIKLGQKVTSENTLGEVGLTGRTSGPHTHLEITHEGKYIDPLALLPAVPNMPFVVNKEATKEANIK